MLTAGQTFRFDFLDEPGTCERVTLPHPEIIEASVPGHVLLIDDGKVKMEVVATGPGYLDCTVVIPGMIKDRKVGVHNMYIYCSFLLLLCLCVMPSCRVVSRGGD